MINLRQLKAFVTVAENKSFTRAAKILYMTQPAISAQIKSLEDRLGVQLIERNDKNIVMTEAGRLFLEEAQKILSIYDGFMESVDELKGVRSGKIFLAASTIPGEYVLPRLIGDFKRRYPGVNVTLNISDTGTVAEKLINRSVDIGVIGAPIKNESLELKEFIKDELIIVSSPHYIQYNEVSPAGLTDFEFVLREPESGTRMVFYERLKECGIDSKNIRVTMELGSTKAIITAVESGLGLSVVSRLAARDSLDLGKLVEIKVKNLSLHRHLYLAWNRNKYQSHSVKAFINFIESGRLTTS